MEVRNWIECTSQGMKERFIEWNFIWREMECNDVLSHYFHDTSFSSGPFTTEGLPFSQKANRFNTDLFTESQLIWTTQTSVEGIPNTFQLFRSTESGLSAVPIFPVYPATRWFLFFKTAISNSLQLERNIFLLACKRFRNQLTTLHTIS